MATQYRTHYMPEPSRERLDALAREAGQFVPNGPHVGQPSRSRLVAAIARGGIVIQASGRDLPKGTTDEYGQPFPFALSAHDWARLEVLADELGIDSWRTLVRLIGDGGFDLHLRDGRVINALELPETRVVPGLRAAPVSS